MLRLRVSTTHLARAGLPLLLALAAGAALAQYKVVGPDGKVTYTDRPPPASTAKVTSLGSRSDNTVGLGDITWPLELRQPVAKYPVTLYTVPGNCDPCQAARQLLRQRGIPYTEKLIQTAEDGEALERLSGGRDAPTLAIGTQLMRGLAPDVWSSYLDAAGYPRDSRLPSTYQYAAATPLVQRSEVKAAAARPASQPDPTPAVPSPGQAGIKF